MKKFGIILMTLLMCSVAGAFAQSTSTRGEGAATIQPRIMVIPYTKSGEDIRTVLDQDVNKRVILTKIREAFDSRGFTTVDFLARLKAAQSNQMLNTEAQSDLKSQIIQASGADIYVEAEINIVKSATGNAVNIILSAYETSTGNSLANKIGDSGSYNTTNYAKLATKAIDTIADDFLAVMQDKFTDIVNNGRSIQIEIGIDASSDMDMYSEVGTNQDALSDAVEAWLAENAFNGYYHIQGVSDKSMVIDEVKIPLRDLQTGANYTATRFASQFMKFLRSVNLSATRTTRNQTLIFLIK